MFLIPFSFYSADTPKLNKDWLRAAKGCGLASALLTIPKEERDAPTLLDYEPTYRSFIRGKESTKGEKKKAPQIIPNDLPEELLPSFEKPLRGVLRLPTEEEPFPDDENMPPRSMKVVLQEKLERKEKEAAELKKSGAPGASGSTPSLKGPLPPPQKRPPIAPTSPKDASVSRKARIIPKALELGVMYRRIKRKKKRKRQASI